MKVALHTIQPAKGSKKSRKRVGRGLASKGTYAGRGNKGQRARSGGRNGLRKKGLRPILLSIPKARGFTSLETKPSILNVGQLNTVFSEGTHITPKLLLDKNLIREKKHGVKILGSGNLQVKLTIEGCQISLSAKEKIEAAGGSIK